MEGSRTVRFIYASARLAGLAARGMMYSRRVDEPGEKTKSEAAAFLAGLCANCVYSRRVESPRGGVFFLCEYSQKDERYPKYPLLPVTRCEAHKSGVNA